MFLQSEANRAALEVAVVGFGCVWLGGIGHGGDEGALGEWVVMGGIEFEEERGKDALCRKLQRRKGGSTQRRSDTMDGMNIGVSIHRPEVYTPNVKNV